MPVSAAVPLPAAAQGRRPGRVVSLVPSLTEAVAVSAPGVLVGATDYCTHPTDLDVARVGGPKYPSIDAILALHPDLVIAEVEENRESDVARLRAAGVPVHVMYPRTLAEAFTELRRLFEVLGVGTPEWLEQAERVWAAPPPPNTAGPGPTVSAAQTNPPVSLAEPVSRRALVPVWRRPWVVLGGGTFAGDLLARLGIRNAYADSTQPYPRPSLEELRAVRPELLVLPDEPYRFTADDGPESFPDTPYVLVSGRHLFWYGPSLVEAREILAGQLASV